MLKSGEIQKLKVARFTGNGAYLTDGEDNEVLLPNRYLSLEVNEGDELEVFIYYDSEDRIVASTDLPYAMAGEVAQLEVIDVNAHGAFLDWGLPKDLFVPISNQKLRMTVGRWYVVMVYVDEVSGRVVATAKLNKFINNETIELQPKQQVEIVIAEEHEVGYRVVINNKNWGMIYHNQIFQPVRIGDIMTAYVTKISEDNRIDLSLSKTGGENIPDAASILERELDSNDGHLPIGDDSSPEEIYDTVNMSKKSFKRAVGALYKAGKIEIGNNWIKTKSVLNK